MTLLSAPEISGWVGIKMKMTFLIVITFCYKYIMIHNNRTFSLKNVSSVKKRKINTYTYYTYVNAKRKKFHYIIYSHCDCFK